MYKENGRYKNIKVDTKYAHFLKVTMFVSVRNGADERPLLISY